MHHTTRQAERTAAVRDLRFRLRTRRPHKRSGNAGAVATALFSLQQVYAYFRYLANLAATKEAVTGSQTFSALRVGCFKYFQPHGLAYIACTVRSNYIIQYIPTNTSGTSRMCVIRTMVHTSIPTNVLGCVVARSFTSHYQSSLGLPDTREAG